MFSERSEAARVLLELGAEAGMTDSDGQLCITALIGRMSPVVTMSCLLTENRAVIGPEKKSLLKLPTFPTILLFLCVKCGKINRIEQNRILVINIVVCCAQAQLALSQFHVTDRMTRQQYYYLNLLEPEPHSSETHVQGNTLLL